MRAWREVRSGKSDALKERIEEAQPGLTGDPEWDGDVLLSYDPARRF